MTEPMSTSTLKPATSLPSPPQPNEVRYLDDHRYPGPPTHPLPASITGTPTQAELDAYPRMFTWGELKDVIKKGELEKLMRNKQMQRRYDAWSRGMKARWGSTEAYLTQARLPWSTSSAPTPQPTYPSGAGAPSGQSKTAQASSTSRSTTADGATSEHLTVGRGGGAPLGRGGISSTTSGASTPSSAGFVSLDSLQDLLEKHKRRQARRARRDAKQAGGQARSGKPLAHGSSTPLRHSVNRGDESGNEGISSAANVNSTSGITADGPSSTCCGQSDEGVAKQREQHRGDVEDDVEGADEEEEEEEEELPEYLRFDPAVGLDKSKYAVLPNDWPYNVPYGVRHYCVWSRVPIAHPRLVDYDPEAWATIEARGLGGFTGIIPLSELGESPIPSQPNSPPLDPTSTDSSASGQNAPPVPHVPLSAFVVDKTVPEGIRPEQWLTVDTAFGGAEMQGWAGEEYECRGGREVGGMVKGLWDERAWECLWFVNPPRLQSVPGFSHFHVFARRKTPEEIDAGEAIWGRERLPQRRARRG